MTESKLGIYHQINEEGMILGKDMRSEMLKLVTEEKKMGIPLILYMHLTASTFGDDARSRLETCFQ